MPEFTDEILKIFRYRANRWKNYKPSVRPSENEIEVYKRIIQSNNESENPNTLVLGCTPELRNMLANLGHHKTIVDINPIMFEKMTELMEMVGNEIIIIDNWLRVHLKHKQFDFIVGDHVINMLSCDDYEKFLEGLGNFLKDEGLFITRVIILPEQRDSVDLILKKHRKKKIQRFNDLIWEICLSVGYCTNERIISYKKLVDEGTRLYKEKFLKKKEYNECMLYDDNMILSTMTEKEYDRLFKKYFNIVSIKYGNDFDFCVNMPIYVLKKII